MSFNGYKRLGDYIRQVDVRNKDLAVTQLLGVSISKDFIPSIANTIGTDMTTYKIVECGQFAYGPVTSRNGDKVSISLLSSVGKAIISQAYTVFEVSKEHELLPEYLMMWFKRPEFDRYARFHSHGSAREIFDWDEMCNVRLPIPSIDQQREVVRRYELLSSRINLNKTIIGKLEEVAQTLYRKYFIDGIDRKHLPEGWKKGILGDIAEISSGTSCKNKVNVIEGNFKYPVAGAAGIIGYSLTYNQNNRLLTVGRVGTLGVVNRYNEPLFAADNVLVIKSDCYEFCYQVLRSIDYEEMIKGGVQNLITQTDLKNTQILLPPENILYSYEEKAIKIYSLVSMKLFENKVLNEIKLMILSTMTNI